MKEKIALKAHDLFFQRGTKAVSIEDIASELGISKKTIYNYFSSKDEIIAYNIDFHISENCCIIDSNREKAKNAIEELVGVYHLNYRQHSMMNPIFIADIKKFHSTEWAKLEKFLNNHILMTIGKNIIRGQEEGLYRDDLHRDLITFLYMRNVISLIDFFSSQTKFSIVSLIKEYIYYHIRGIGTDKGIKYLNNINLEI